MEPLAGEKDAKCYIDSSAVSYDRYELAGVLYLLVVDAKGIHALKFNTGWPRTRGLLLRLRSVWIGGIEYDGPTCNLRR